MNSQYKGLTVLLLAMMAAAMTVPATAVPIAPGARRPASSLAIIPCAPIRGTLIARPLQPALMSGSLDRLKNSA